MRGRAAALEVSIEEGGISGADGARVTGTIACGARAAAPWASAWSCRRQFRSRQCAAEEGKQRAGVSRDDEHAAVVRGKSWGKCSERISRSERTTQVLVVRGELSDADGRMRRLRFVE